MNWPDEVDILTADDVCKGKMDAPGETHCALGWIRTWFCIGHQQAKASHTLERTINDLWIMRWNDHPRRKLADIAAALNETNRRLGYDVPRKACGRFYDKKAKVMG